MLRAAVLLAALAGCGGAMDEPVADSLAPPPPFNLGLISVTRDYLVGGVPSVFRVSGIPGPTMMQIVVSPVGTGSACLSSPPICTDLASPLVTVATRSGVSGTVDVVITPPTSMGDGAAVFQAFSGGPGQPRSAPLALTRYQALGDPDGDGLISAMEAGLGTHPGQVDSDQDGLDDGDEWSVWYTDPADPDTDADGLTDGEELFTWRTDPRDPDSDGDRLSDGDEVLVHGSSPVDVDSDDDTLEDGDEVLSWGTNPADADTDHDLLSDAAELHLHLTDPLLADTDGGSIPDGAELSSLTDPLDPSDDVDSMIVLDPSWTTQRRIPLTNALSGHFAPDGEIWAASNNDSTEGGGLYYTTRRAAFLKAATVDTPDGVVVGADGAAFVNEDSVGTVWRYTEAGGLQTWVVGFHSGDDDPAAMDVATTTRTGGFLTPGEALVGDRGFSGPDEIWRFSTLTAEGEVVLHPDNGTFEDITDILITPTEVLAVDATRKRLNRVSSAGVVTQVTLDVALQSPVGLAWDPIEGRVLLLDSVLRQLLSVDMATGATEVIIDAVVGRGLSSIDVSADGQMLALTQVDGVVLFTRCVGPGGPLGLDCDVDGLSDLCEVETSDDIDCDGDGALDRCEIAAGTELDCDVNGVPDSCPDCGGLDVVFAVDTSTSMNDEAGALCDKLAGVAAALEAGGIGVQVSILGISDAPGGAYDCLEGHVIGQYGTAVPDSPAPTQAVLGACPGGLEVASEDWGRATSVLAGAYPWRPGAVRLVIPVADEGPWCGDPVSDPGVDRDSINHAVSVASTRDVVVSPITGTGATAAVINMATALASGTGGTTRTTAFADSDLVESILDIAGDACAAVWDCNGNGVPDSCDISSGFETDCDGNGVPDSCDIAAGGDPCGP